MGFAYHGKEVTSVNVGYSYLGVNVQYEFTDFCFVCVKLLPIPLPSIQAVFA